MDGLTSLLGTWLVLAFGKFLEAREGDPVLCRFGMLVVGMLIWGHRYRTGKMVAGGTNVPFGNSTGVWRNVGDAVSHERRATVTGRRGLLWWIAVLAALVEAG